MRLTIPLRNIYDLPPMAVYTAKNGRASVSVRMEVDSIFITASCDSLQALCEYYEREITRIRGDTAVYKTASETSTAVPSLFKCLLIGMAVGVLAGATVIFILRR